MTEDIAEDYEQYREVMEQMSNHFVFVDAAKYVDSYGVDKFLKHLQTYVDSPQQSMLLQRSIEFMSGSSNDLLRNSDAAQWIRANVEINDDI